MYRVQKWPRWLTLIPEQDDAPAGEVYFRRIRRAMKVRAHAEAAKGLSELAEGEERGQAEVDAYAAAFSRSLIVQGAQDWRGIGDEGGVVLAFSPEALAYALDDDLFFDRADEEYVLPEVLRDAQKNGSSVSPTGTGEAGTQAADIVSSPATPGMGSAATSAPMSKTNRKPRKRKTSGI